MTWRRALAVAAGLVALAAGVIALLVLGGGGGGLPVAGAAAPPRVGCATRTQLLPSRRHPGGITKSQRRASVTAGPVLFSGARLWRDRGEEVKALAGVKVPILVDAGRAVTISVPATDGQIDVGRDRGPSVRGPRVELRPCRPSARVGGRRVGRRTPFAAGFDLAHPVCLRVSVAVPGRGRPIRRRLPLGRPCGP